MRTGVGVGHLPLNGVSANAALVIRIHLIINPVCPICDIPSPLFNLHFRFRRPGGHEMRCGRTAGVRVAHGAGFVEIRPGFGLFVRSFITSTACVSQLGLKRHPHIFSRFHGPIPFGILRECCGKIEFNLLAPAHCGRDDIHCHRAALVGGRSGSIHILQARGKKLKEFHVIDVGFSGVLRTEGEGCRVLATVVHKLCCMLGHDKIGLAQDHDALFCDEIVTGDVPRTPPKLCVNIQRNTAGQLCEKFQNALSSRRNLVISEGEFMIPRAFHII